MNNCVKCGNQLNDENKFCIKCGTPVPDNANDKTSQEKPTTEKKKVAETKKPAVEKEKVVKPKKPIDTKTKKTIQLLAIAVAVVVVMGFVAFRVGASLTSRDKVIDKFITAITEKDVKELANMLKSSDPRMEINEESLKPFINYLDENPSYFDRLVSAMEEEQLPRDKNPKNSRGERPVFSREEDEDKNVISLKKKGKKYLFYDNYEFIIKPFFVRLSTNYEGATLYLDDKVLGTSNSDNYSLESGPFLPGKYTIKSTYSGEYTTIENQKEIYLITEDYDSYSKVLNHDLYLEGKYIYVDTNYYDGEVLVNGKNTGLTAREVNEMGLGPVDDATMIQLAMDFPWATINSEEVSVADSGTYIRLYIDPINGDVQKEIIDAVNTFLHDDSVAFNTRNAKAFTNLADPELESRKKRIADMIEWERHDILEMERASYDLDSHTISLNNNEYHSQISGLYEYKKATYYEGDEAPEPSEQYSRWKYNLKYDEQEEKWLIYRLDSQYYFNDNNTVDYDFVK